VTRPGKMAARTVLALTGIALLAANLYALRNYYFLENRWVKSDLRDAAGKLDSNQGTLGKFFSDPAFYDNFTGLAGDMRLMVSDFRQNPKKFLHVKMGIF